MIRIEFTSSALKSIKKLNKTVQEKIMSKLEDFSQHRPTDYKKLKGYNDLYRIRVNEYRIVLQLVIIENTAYVIRVGHRREVYKNLP